MPFEATGHDSRPGTHITVSVTVGVVATRDRVAVGHGGNPERSIPIDP